MRFYFFWLMLFMVPASHGDEMVRVLLDEAAPQVDMSFLGPAEISTEQQKIAIYDSYFQTHLVRQGDQWLLKVSRRNNQNKYNDEHYYLRGRQIRFFSIAAFQWNQQRVDFPLHVFNQKNTFSVVGVMSMDRYLQGVVEHEMPASWPLESLKAQVVASRTYAYWKMAKNKKDDYDLRPSVMDQVFRLPRWGMPSSAAPQVVQAIAATSGQILVDASNRVFKTYFHADCGGATTTTEKAWGETTGKFRSVQDRSCQLRSSEWVSVWSRHQLQQLFAKNMFIPPQSQLMDILVRTKDSSERVEWVDLIFTKGVFKRLRGEDLRRYLGYDQLKSTVFQVSQRSGGWSFAGRGFGHGVGLCQHGAKVLAKNGSPYVKILSHYYPASRLIEKHAQKTLQARVVSPSDIGVY